MRTSTLLISAAFGAGVLAHPFHMHSHLKRGDGETKLIKSYQEGNTLFKEYETVVVVDANGQAQPQPQVHSEQKPAAPAPSAPKPEVKFTQQQPKKPAAPAPQAPKAEEKAAPPTQSKSSSGSGDSGSCSTPDLVGGSASEWGDSPCSGGKKIIDIFNEMRAQWNPSLKDTPYIWDAELAANAYNTGIGPEDDGTQMNHKLFPGSMAQCIAESLDEGMGDGMSSFGEAAKMWMCEIQQGPFCDTKTNGVGDDPDGHAKIIQDTQYTRTGCAKIHPPDGSMGMWTCDFAPPGS